MGHVNHSWFCTADAHFLQKVVSQLSLPSDQAKSKENSKQMAVIMRRQRTMEMVMSLPHRSVYLSFFKRRKFSSLHFSYLLFYLHFRDNGLLPF
ncbi:uncharacterized protein LOC143465449 isoform X3 [Clavelina lepadiformis]|uniref:uncharacterized protein LOC143465449 isoform X3 n=1 Tax=Clavelina lepadiformis TaxID=159417 RepID=UPI0040432217